MSIALWCLFIAGLLHVLSKAPLMRAQSRCEGGYDNNQPREQHAALDPWGKRALAAHENQIESFPLFAAGVLVAVATGVTSPVVDYLAIAFIVARVVYIFLYVQDVATLRSMVWMVGYLSSLALLCSPAWG
jgi:uncharacterized MAPEG superfamily protein